MWKIISILLFLHISDVLTLEKQDINDFSNSEASRNLVKKINIDTLDYEKRKEIVKNYMETLGKSENDWVDPYDMLPRDEKQSLTSVVSEEPSIDNDYKPVFSDIRGEVMDPKFTPKDETDGVIKTSNSFFSNPKHQKCFLDSIYISRWLKMLIMKIETDSYVEPTALVIPLDSDSLSELKTISAETLNVGELDELVSNLISQSFATSKKTYDWAALASYTGYGICVITLGLFAYFFCILLIHRPIWTVFWIFILICIFWHWMHLYQQKIALKHSHLASMQAPSSCKKNEFSLLESINEYIKSIFRTSDCSKYYEALMVDPFWEVSLSVAISEAVSAMFFQPLETGARKMNASLKILVDGLSLISIGILVIFLFFFIVMFFKYRINFPFFMGSLEPGYARREYVEDVRPCKTIEGINSLIKKSAVNIEKEDRKVSGLLKGELYKGLNSATSKKSCVEGCKLTDCYDTSELTCKKCEKSLELASTKYSIDQESNIEKSEDFDFSKKLCDVSDNVLCQNIDYDVCINCHIKSFSNSEPNELTESKTC